MKSPIKLTVLDQSPNHTSATTHQLLNAGQMSVELAKACDNLGYYRYWVAEHHNSQQFAGASPEILIAAIASVTRNMRIGSGGVMLSHYSPYKVAEVFNMLNALFPDRIDLGIGRAPGGTGLSSSALAWPSRILDSDVYPDQASTLKGLLERNISNDHPWHKLHMTPSLKAPPQMWMLGSSGGSAKLAGQLGMNLALARFISPDHCSPEIFNDYDNAWYASGHNGKPNKILAIGAFCADTQEESELLASTAVYRKMMLSSQKSDILLAPEVVQNKRKKFNSSEEAQYQHILKGYTVGTPERCKTEIDSLAKKFRVDEIAIVTVTYDFSSRLNSYRLLCDKFTK